MCFVAGTALFIFVGEVERRVTAGTLRVHLRGNGSTLFFFVYLFFGKWPPAIAVWTAGILLLIKSWRQKPIGPLRR